MKLYNTASRKIETFKPAGEVAKIYTCGPTVYAQAHIGNLTAYIYWDLLVRALRAEGLSVKRVLNLTDVGHLVSDGDEGEDKLEKGAKREGKSVYEIAESYIELFKKDYHDLELSEPEVWAKATDYIDEDTIVGRYGGDTFVVIFENGVREENLDALNQIRKDFSKKKYSFTKEPVTISGGYSWFDVTMDLKSALDEVEKALSSAKSSGKNIIMASGESED